MFVQEKASLLLALVKIHNHSHISTIPWRSNNAEARLNESSTIQHFEYSNAIEIFNGIIFDFYTGLPQIFMHLWSEIQRSERVGGIKTQFNKTKDI